MWNCTLATHSMCMRRSNLGNRTSRWNHSNWNARRGDVTSRRAVDIQHHEGALPQTFRHIVPHGALCGRDAHTHCLMSTRTTVVRARWCIAHLRPVAHQSSPSNDILILRVAPQLPFHPCFIHHLYSTLPSPASCYAPCHPSIS